MPDISSMRSKEFQVKETSNTELLKDYLKRLGNGEDLESVKKDFVQNFSDVEASEIMKAEQELIKEGTPITEVQKLCDVHSALFHGLTKEEKIANAEKAVEESLKKEETSEKKIIISVGGLPQSSHQHFTFNNKQHYETHLFSSCVVIGIGINSLHR